MDCGCRMLVADRSDEIRRLFREAASRAHMPVTLVEASDGNQCKRLLTKGQIHLAFIDVDLPGSSGVEVTAAVRQAGIGTFVTLMSAWRDEEFVELARLLKVYEFLLKPFGVDQIQSVIRTYNHIASPLRALIIDHSDAAGRIIKRALARGVFRLTLERTADPRAAVALCKSEVFDIVFVNCDLPKHDALAILKRVKRHNPSSKIVMIAGARNWNCQLAAARLGAAGFLEEPISPEQVDTVLHRLYGLPIPAPQSTGAHGDVDPASLVA